MKNTGTLTIRTGDGAIAVLRAVMSGDEEEETEESEIGHGHGHGEAGEEEEAEELGRYALAHTVTAHLGRQR